MRMENRRFLVKLRPFNFRSVEPLKSFDEVCKTRIIFTRFRPSFEITTSGLRVVRLHNHATRYIIEINFTRVLAEYYARRAFLIGLLS